MNRGRLALIASAALSFGACVFDASAQIPPAQPDPLARRPVVIEGQGACSAKESSACAEAIPKIIANALGSSPLEENLRRLTDVVGGRPTGSQAMKRAVEWGVEAFRQAGVDDVHTEKYTISATWSEGASRLEVLAPMPFPVRLASVGWSPATPAGGIEAGVLDVGGGSAEEFAAAGTRVRGAIVLVHSEIGHTWNDLFNDYLRAPAIIDRAVKSGAAAILWMSTRDQLVLYRHQNTLTGQLDRLPQAVVAREDAERIARFISAGTAVRVRLDMPNRIGGPTEQENVVAEIRGREKPEEWVLLGAHLDSWDLGTGALDNGCNAALAIEAARAIVASGVKPRRSLRFVLFSGEEQGALGSWAYAKSHRGELDRAIAGVFFDEGIGRVTGYSLGGRKDIEAAVSEILKPIQSWGANAHTADAFFGTDNFDFLLEGVPTLVANQEEANYLPNYHAISDTFDKVDMRELKLHTALAAVTVFGLAERAERIAARQTRAQIDALLKETGLDQQMQTYGIWDDWRQGRRGRQP